MKTNIVIGRFQIDQLTLGHKYFIETIMKKRKADKLVFFIGVSPLSYNNRNPLPPISRRKMLEKEYPGCIVKYVHDNPSDIEWSEQLDRQIAQFKYPVLFGSRDSFIPHYRGKHKYVEIKEMKAVVATHIRKAIGTDIWNTKDFRRGIIHAVENRFPTAYPTIDIAVIRCRLGMTVYPLTERAGWSFAGTKELLLGRKTGKIKYVFPGGFVDPTDESLEQAAGRELSEEVPGIITHEFKYIGSTKVDDFRYKGTKDGIITSLFVTYVMGGSIKAGDDIEETRFFNLENFNLSLLSEYHHPLYHMLMKYLRNK